MLKVAKVVGLNSDTAATLALTSQKEQQFFCAIIACECEDAFSKVRQALSLAEEIFYSNPLAIPQKLPEIFKEIQTFLQGSEKVEIELAAVAEDESGTVLYLVANGENLTAYLLQENGQNNLSDLSRGEVVSGVIREGDKILLCTQSLLEFYGHKLDILRQIPLENLEDEITLKLPEVQASPVAVIVLEKEPENQLKEVEIPATGERDFKAVFGLVAYVFKKIAPHSKKGFFLVGIILLILSLGGTFLSYQNQKRVEKDNQFNSALNQAKEQLSKTMSLKDTDSAGATQSLEQVKKEIALALNIQPQNQEALNVKKQAEEMGPEILKIFPVNDFPVWMDLGLIKDGFKARSLSVSHGKLLILDTGKKTLVSIDLKNKSHEFLGGGNNLGDAKLASLNGNVAWVYAEDKGLIKIDGETISTAVKTDNEWGEIVDIYGFAGNIYLLDEGKNQIWKYLPIVDGYSDKREYFKTDTKVSFTGVKKMQIESSIYVLKGGGEILRFTQGSPDFFSFSGLDKPVKELRSFFISSEVDSLYLLDGSNNRLLVLDKKGVYQAQYQSDKFNQFTDLVVDEEEKKVYLLEGSKIYSIELK